MVVEVKDKELMMFSERICERGEKTEGRRQRGEVSYTPQEQTWCVSTPAWLSRSLLQLNTLSIISGTCMLSECHGDIESS